MQTRYLPRIAFLAIVGLVLANAANAWAHFVWIETEPQNEQWLVRSGFGELEGWDPDLADRMRQSQFWVRKSSKLEKLEPPFDTASSEYRATVAQDASAILAACDFGVIAFGGNPPSWLRYTAKNLVGSPSNWRDDKHADELRVEILAKLEKDGVRLTAFHLGKPLAGATIKATAPNGDYVELPTDEHGVARWPLAGAGLYACYVGVTIDEAGKAHDQSYEALKDYATLTFKLDSDDLAAAEALLPNLPEAVTSFGAAVADGWLYVYSGHIGGTHEHSIDNLSKAFRRINLTDPAEWEELPAGPPLQGLSLVAHGGKLIRVGGMAARNTWDQEEDMHSTAEVAMFDPATKTWMALASLPEARSSHDCVVIGDWLYVAGGWELRGKDKESVWRDTAYRLNLAEASSAQWEALPKQPFQRRALSLAAAGGKVYVIGGLSAKGLTTEVDVFDPAANAWSKAPPLPEGRMEGFSPGAVGVGDALIASPFSGVVYRLDGGTWAECAKLDVPRFLHRLLAAEPGRLIAVAGSSREGHLDSIENLAITQ